MSFCNESKTCDCKSEASNEIIVDNNNEEPDIDSGKFYGVRNQIEENPRDLIPHICKQFFKRGWLSGTSGGLSMRHNGLIYCSPSGVQKERLKPEDIFVLNGHGDTIIQRPMNDNLKCSDCLILFMIPFAIRKANCCLHSHSLNANLVSSLCEKLSLDKTGRCSSNGLSEFRIKDQEMIKGIKQGSSDQRMKNIDTIIVPILENTLNECDLKEPMIEAIKKYPLTNAILVKNHGLYVWGNTWMEAKSMAECYDYLFRIKLEAFKLGFDWI